MKADVEKTIAMIDEHEKQAKIPLLKNKGLRRCEGLCIEYSEVLSGDVRRRPVAARSRGSAAFSPQKKFSKCFTITS